MELYADAGDGNIKNATLTGPINSSKFTRLTGSDVIYFNSSNIRVLAQLNAQPAYAWNSDPTTSRSQANTNLDMNANRYIVMFLDQEILNPQLYAVKETDYPSVRLTYDVVPIYYLVYRDWRSYQIRPVKAAPGCYCSLPAVQTVAGGYNQGTIDGALGTNEISIVSQLAWGPDGKIWFVNNDGSGGFTIRTYDPVSGLVATTPYTPYSGQGFFGIAFAPNKDLWFTSFDNGDLGLGGLQVLSRRPVSGPPTDIVFSSTTTHTLPCDPTFFKIGGLSQIVISPDGNRVYFYSGVLEQVFYYQLSDGFVHLFAGNGNQPSLAHPDVGENVLAVNAIAGKINGICIDGSGNVYWTDADYGMVRKVTVATGIIQSLTNHTTALNTVDYTGDGFPAFTFSNNTAQFNVLSGIATDKCGNIILSDLGNGAIRLIDPTGMLSTVVGGGGFDGPYPTTSISGLALQFAYDYFYPLYDGAGSSLLVNPKGGYYIYFMGALYFTSCIPINGIALCSSFQGEYGTAALGILNSPGGAFFGPSPAAPNGDLLGCSENQIDSDNSRRVCTIDASGQVRLTFPMDLPRKSINISSGIFNALTSRIPLSSTINALGIACNGSTWWVLTELLAYNYTSGTGSPSDYGLYVVQSTDLVTWTLTRILYDGYGTVEGLLTQPSVFLNFDINTGVLNGITVFAQVRFSDGAAVEYNATIPASPSIPSPVTIWGNKDGTMSTTSGDIKIMTITLQQSSSVYVSYTDPRNFGGYSTAVAVDPDTLAGISPFIGGGLREDYIVNSGGLHAARPGFWFDTIGVVGADFDLEPFFSYVVSGLSVSIPTSWGNVILCASQSNTTGQTSIAILDPAGTILQEVSALQVDDEFYPNAFIYQGIGTIISSQVSGSPLIAPDIFAYGVGIGGTILILLGTIWQRATGSSTPITLNLTTQTFLNNSGKGNYNSFIRFSKDIAPYIWCYNNIYQQGDDQAFTSTIFTGIIDSDGTLDIGGGAVTTSIGNNGTFITPILELENCCGDGTDGLYTTDYTTGNILHRAGASGAAWTVIVSGLLGAGSAVVGMQLSHLYPGTLLIVYGPQFTYNANYIYITLSDYSIYSSGTFYFPIYNAFGIFVSGSSQSSGGFFTTACEVS